MILEKTTHTLSNLSSKLKLLSRVRGSTNYFLYFTAGLSFPFNLIAPIALVILIGYILKLTFKYVISPKAWMGFFHMRSNSPTAGNQATVTAGESGGDRLSGDNLKMLLNVINASSITQIQQQQQPQPLAVSGVQELLEPLEAPPEAEAKSKSNSANNSQEKLNDSSSSAHIAEDAGFTLVDDVEDNNS